MKEIFIVLIIFLLIVSPVLAAEPTEFKNNLNFNNIIGYVITAKQQGVGAAATQVGKEYVMSAVTTENPQAAQALGIVQNIQNPQGAVLGLANSELQKQNPDAAKVLDYYNQATNWFSNPSGAIMQTFMSQAQEQNAGFGKAYQVYQMLQQSKVLASSGGSQQNVE
ncbi:hypothetical protein J4468_00470 [Candidatus Woesearchaeota archaeon]|nr:hypothetical protein [Candidatus Woesearchaeota archaeon]